MRYLSIEKLDFIDVEEFEDQANVEFVNDGYDNFTFENGKVLRYDLEDGRNVTLSLEHMGMNLILKQNDLKTRKLV